ncbi:MAG: phosphotyrosine protein phosphatase [Candidatus Hydrogenedentota bacterium]
MVKVLFVCMGNICRSPTAEALMRHHAKARGLAHRIHIDSAGTHAYHVGETPDPRSRQEAERRGVSMADIRARAVEPGDFESFDYILVMDDVNYEHLIRICPPSHRGKIQYLLSYHPETELTSVPDPYYGGARGFIHVFDLVEGGIRGFIEHLEAGRLAQQA